MFIYYRLLYNLFWLDFSFYLWYRLKLYFVLTCQSVLSGLEETKVKFFINKMKSEESETLIMRGMKATEKAMFTQMQAKKGLKSLAKKQWQH